MKYRKLGKTGLDVSEIGLGTAQLGGPSFIAGRYIGSPRIERSEAIRMLEKAFDSGINFYDTSDKYGDGEAERILGEVFAGRKKKVVLATKCGITEEGKRCFEEKYVRSCLENSLKNLRVEYIDLFQLTKPDINIINSGSIYGIFDKLKKEGKIRYCGVSTGTDEETMQLIADNKVDALQIFYNLLHIRPNKIFISNAFNNDIGLIIRSPLSSGVLTGRYNYNTRFSSEDDRSEFLFGKTLISRVDMVKKIVEQYSLGENYNILQFSLNYPLSNKKISTIIPGVSKSRQLDDILKLEEVKRMNSNFFSEVEEFIRINFNEGG